MRWGEACSNVLSQRGYLQYEPERWDASISGCANSPWIPEPVERGPLSVLEEQFLLCTFPDVVEVSLVSLPPERSRCKVVIHVPRQEWPVVLVVLIILGLVAWCRASRGRGTRWVWVSSESREAVRGGRSDDKKNRVSPNGSTEPCGEQEAGQKSDEAGAHTI